LASFYIHINPFIPPYALKPLIALKSAFLSNRKTQRNSFSNFFEVNFLGNRFKYLYLYQEDGFFSLSFHSWLKRSCGANAPQ